MAWAIRLIHKTLAVLLQVTWLMQRICATTTRRATTMRTASRTPRVNTMTLVAFAVAVASPPATVTATATRTMRLASAAARARRTQTRTVFAMTQATICVRTPVRIITQRTLL